jgi:hypothetical protein
VSPLHGIASAYNSRGCRCELCRAWRRNYDREYTIRTDRNARRRQQRAKRNREQIQGW